MLCVEEAPGQRSPGTLIEMGLVITPSTPCWKVGVPKKCLFPASKFSWSHKYAMFMMQGGTTVSLLNDWLVTPHVFHTTTQ